MLISKNAYLILWLGTDADEKLLNKRHKEILKILEIDEVPEYETDFSFIKYKNIRNVESVKWAFHELSNQKKRVYQDFLWFQLVDNKDEKLFKQLCDWNILEAIEWWKDLYDTTWKYHYLKNLFVANLLWFEHQKQFKDLDFSDDWPEIINELHECIESDKFWKEFLKIINLSYETPLSNEELNKFRWDIVQYLAEEFFDLSEELKAPKLYVQYNKVFGVYAKELDDNENVTKPLSIIEKNSKKMKELDLWSDLDEIIDLINEIEDEVKKLTKVWLQKNPKIVKVVDDVSLQIRSLGIALVNDHDDKDTAIDFINEALSLSPSTTIAQKLKKDIKDIQSIEKNSATLTTLTDMIKRWSELWDNKDWSSAKTQYQKIIDYIEWDLKETFNLNEHYLEKFKEKTQRQINRIYAWMPQYEMNAVLWEIDKVNGFIKNWWGFTWWNDLEVWYLSPEEWLLYYFYIDAVVKVTLQNKINQVKQEKRSEWCRSWIIWIVIMIILAAIWWAFD